MRLLLLISLSLVLLAVPAACAQTADEFFNGGAQFYISNNIPAALKKTESGLKLYPDSVKLKKLEELLKQQQQRQNQKQKQQKKNNQSQNQQQNQSQSARQNQQKKLQNQQAQKQSKPQEKQQEASGKKRESQNGQKPPAAGQMTPQEAKRLLDAQKGNEQFLQFKPKPPPPGSPRPIEDW